MHFDISYFTGTGNTLDAVQTVRDVLLNAGHQCRLIDIETASPQAVGVEERDRGADSTMILAFPVYAWAPPSLVLRWVRKLPAGRGRRAVVLAVDGGDGMRATATGARALARRGYSVQLEARISYPDNWTQVIPPKSPEQATALVESGRLSAERVANDILSGRTGSEAPGGILPRVMGLVGLVFRGLARRLLGQLYVADARCTSCRLCERACPVGAIVMRSTVDSRPRWRATCESCNRCINICPTQAINTSWVRIATMFIVVTVLSVLFIRLGRVALGDLWIHVAAVRVSGGTLCVLLAHSLYLAVAPVVFALEHRRWLRRFTYAGFTKGYYRYTAPSFRPPIHSSRRTVK